jgi:ferritin-like metal-binding protein YciE
MGIFTKDIKTMEDLFLHQLEDIYYAEQQLTKAIPKMADRATNADLKAGLKSHVIDTKNQLERLDKVFAKLGQKPKGTDCPAIDGLIKEADDTAGEIEDKRCWTRPSSPILKPWSTMKCHATAPSSHGPKSLDTTMLFVS